MQVGTYLAIYFIVWWTVLFAVLPWGVRSQAEAGTTEPGTDPGAPTRPLLLRKVIATSLVAACVTAGIFWLGTSGVVRLEDFPMPFRTDAR
ncbi:DUF1467 family protein [Aquabacter spiritensis]|uniref:Putative secreted protein n=1 Tax=Aquabacter spiritensis TaxID=933073 RepID=A0A4R3LPA8_9HYPH|nr:DUF1467 family protein [Aquabacter spiritensis]TCT01536.1 putative secreted protein [Aquabacter spiritensis]